MITILSIPDNLVLDKNIQQFMPFLALLKILIKKLDERNISFVIFVDFQKVFSTVEQDILLTKLKHCGIRALANEKSLK